MIEGKNVPKIRFPEFNGEWEEYELGQLMSRYEDHVETPHNGYERLGIRSHAKGVFHSHVNAGEELETAKMQRVAADKFIVNITFAWEHAVAITDENDAGLLVSHRFPQFSFDEKLQSGFFGFQMLDKRFKKHLELSSPGGAGRNRVLKIDDMMKYTVRIPSVAEQKKIASFLQMVDQIICEIQSDLDKWKELKRGMLQKMLPKEGESVPEIRFPGFSDAWKKHKLSDFSDIIGGGTPDTNNPAYWDGDIDWYAPAEMEGQRYAVSSVRKITELGLQKSSAKILPANRTVLFTSRAGIGKMAILQRPAATNQGFQSLVLRDEVDPYFIYSMGDKIKKKAEGVASGSTFLEISGKMLANLEVLIPTTEEQKEIASFFREIDDFITLYQCENDKWKELKKGLLQQMFV